MELGESENLNSELPPIYEGVTQEVFTDYLLNKEGFIKETLGVLQEENPALARLFIDGCHISPDIERSLMFGLEYYAILLRSAKKSGKAMIVVTEDRNRAVWSEAADKFSSLMNSPEGVDKAIEEMNGILEKDIDSETSSSDELAHFWATAHLFVGGALPDGREFRRRRQILKPLNDIAQLIHAQIRSNRLQKDWKHS